MYNGMKLKTYIYIVTNIEGNPDVIYVGKTTEPKSREYKHKKRYGNSVSFNVIDELHSLSSKYWKPVECFWIQHFKDCGYKLMNKNNGGGGSDVKSIESVKSMIKNLSKPINQYDLKGNFIKEWSSIKEAKTSTSCDISSCLRGLNKTAGDYIWKYKKDITPNFEFNKSSSKGNKVFQFDKNGFFIKEWNSTQEAEREYNQKYSRDNIGSCCRKKQKSAYGYIWSYESKPELEYYLNRDNKPVGFGNHKYVKVNQYSLKGEFIKEWSSIKEANKFYNIKNDNISKCCNNKQKQTKGFVWTYINHNNK